MQKENKKKPTALKKISVIGNKQNKMKNITSNKANKPTLNNKQAKQDPPKKKPRRNDDFDVRGNKNKKKRYTEDGYPIYSLEELNIKFNPVMTGDCPFDCDCCT